MSSSNPAAIFGRSSTIVTSLPAAGPQAGHPGARLDLQALPLKQPGEGAHDVVIESRGDLRQELDDSDVAAQPRPDGPQFEPDGTAPDHHEGGGRPLKGDRVVARDDRPAVES